MSDLIFTIAGSRTDIRGGESASANCGKGVVVQGDANANGAAPDIGGRK